MRPTSHRLLGPTNRSSAGPRFVPRGDSIDVEYDVEHDDGAAEWFVVRFGDVVDFKFRPVSACDDGDIVGAEIVREQDPGVTARAAVARWADSVGWQSWNVERGVHERFAEFTMFFDNVGAATVVAASCSILNRNEPPDVRRHGSRF